MLDSYFILTNKFNLIDRLLYDLIQFFDHLVVAYFFGPPCTMQVISKAGGGADTKHGGEASQISKHHQKVI